MFKRYYIFFNKIVSQETKINRQFHSFKSLLTMSRARQAPQSQGQQPPQPQQPNPDDMEVSTPSTQPTQPAVGGQSNLNLGAAQGSSSPSTELDRAFQMMQLRPKEFVCEFYDLEMATKKGVVLQYINNNAAGSACMIGSTRINIVDPRKVPLYLARNMSIIRQHAVSTLKIHFKNTLCAAGALEKLSADDFSISFSWASITDAGRSLNPRGLSELPLGYAAYEYLVAPMWLSRADPGPSYVVNVHIYLQEPMRRITTVIQKAKEEEALKAEHAKRPQIHRNRGFVQGNAQAGNHQLQEDVTKLSATVASFNEVLKRAAPVEQQYPPLPIGAPPEWNKSGRTPLPDE